MLVMEYARHQGLASRRQIAQLRSPVGCASPPTVTLHPQSIQPPVSKTTPPFGETFLGPGGMRASTFRCPSRREGRACWINEFRFWNPRPNSKIKPFPDQVWKALTFPPLPAGPRIPPGSQNRCGGYRLGHI
jgi:hypothetical protein